MLLNFSETVFGLTDSKKKNIPCVVRPKNYYDVID